MARKAKLGSGKRFAAVEAAAARSGAKNPAAVAAAAGRAKFGNKRFAALFAMGRHRAALARHHGNAGNPRSF